MIGKKRKKFGFFGYFFVFLLGVISTVGCVYLLEFKFMPVKSSNGVCYTNCTNKVKVVDNGIKDAVSRVYDGVVLVENYRKHKLYGSGTGFVYKVDSENGYLLTNYHVIKGYSKLSIVLNDGRSVSAKYLGGDEFLDMAVLSIPKEYVDTVLEFGKSSDVFVGDTVFTIGNPVNSEYLGTVTRGILSGKDRMITVSISGVDDYVMKVLQTDAAVNPGNSGGPLCNSNGEVIGMISLKLVKNEVEGMGFALTVEDISRYLSDFESGKAVNRPYLGISMLNVNDTYYLKSLGINLDSNITSGVVVLDVLEGSSVKGVLKKGDVITKIGNSEVKNIAYLRYELYKYQVGDSVDITYLRDNKENVEKIVLSGKS